MRSLRKKLKEEGSWSRQTIERKMRSFSGEGSSKKSNFLLKEGLPGLTNIAPCFLTSTGLFIFIFNFFFFFGHQLAVSVWVGGAICLSWSNLFFRVHALFLGFLCPSLYKIDA